MANSLYVLISLVGEGRENAVSAERCRDGLGFNDTRPIRRLRAEHNNNKENSIKILTCSKGYYIPTNSDELQHEIKSKAFNQIRRGIKQIQEGRELLRVANLEGQYKIDYETGEVNEIELQH